MEEERFDEFSVTSDFSIIPENAVNAETIDTENPVSVSPAMIKSITEDSTNESTSSSQIMVTGATGGSHNNVTFGTIQRVNNEPEGDLAVVFSNTSTSEFSLKSSDRIALYKMGFSSSKDFIACEWVPVAASSQQESLSHISLSLTVPTTVIFKASNVPKDKAEFYQFCYLTHDGNIEGVSVPFQLEQVEKSKLVEMECMARNILVLRVNSLLEEQKNYTQQIKDLNIQLETQQTKTEDVEQFEMVVDVEKLETKLQEVTEELKKAIAERDALHLQSTQELQAKQLELDIITENLSKIVLQNSLLQENLQALSEEKKVAIERQEVILSDFQDLKERLEHANREKEAAQKIAGHLSENNMKMAKKLETHMKVEKKIMETIASESSQTVQAEGAENKALEEAEVAESVVGSIVHSQCAIELAPKIDDILSELRELKMENQRSLLKAMQNSSFSFVEGSIASTAAASEEEHQVNNLEGATETKENHVVEEESSKPKEENETEERKVEKSNLYGQAFLPTTQTAPVFLPPTSEPSAPSMLDSYSFIQTPFPLAQSLSAMTQTDSRSVSMNGTQTERPSPPAPAPRTSTGTQLPPPLKPETTTTARNAAVLMQFNEGRNPESDDDDYHSTRDSEEVSNQTETNSSKSKKANLECPMCDLGFSASAIHILNEHIDSHLEKICPICSQAFSRIVKQDEFETHVQTHFENEVEEPVVTNPSGPWGDNRDTSGFHLLEID